MNRQDWTRQLLVPSVLSLALIIVSPATSLNSDESYLFGLQTDVLNPGTTEEYMHYMFPSNSTDYLTSVTLCIRIRILQYREIVPFFSYAYSDLYDNAFLTYQNGPEMQFYYNDLKESSGLGLHVDGSLGGWHHTCLVFEHPSFKLYFDGELISEGKLGGTNGIIPLNGSLYIGQEQDRFNGGTDPTQTISGYVSQMNIWNYALNNGTIRDIASCAVNLRGNVLSTDVDEFDTPGVEKTVIPVRKLCTDDSAFVIIPMERYLTEALVFCNLVNTSVYIPPNTDMNIKLYEDSFQFKNACDSKSYRRLLLGATDEETEGTWNNVKTGKPITYSAWGPGEPNSGANDNCLVLRNDMPFWGDLECAARHCFPCGRAAHDFVFVRGLCRPVEHQIRFIIDGYVNNRPYFRGYYGMAIYSTGGTGWLFKDTMTNMTIATAHLHQPEDYPIGRTIWEVEETYCSFAPGETMELGLSSCTTDQYMCSDGSCVPRDVRCNLREDCRDGSDESNCGIVAFTGRYASHRPPPGQTFKDKLYIFPHVHLVRFSKIDDIQLAFYMEYEVHLAWTDRNLKFKNIKDEEAKNKLSESEVESIWTPEVDFLNVNDGLLKSLKSGVYARKTGDPDPPLFNDVKMDTVYQPQNVSLVQKNFYSGSFSCNFGLFKYPFDTQICSVLIKLDSADTSVITFSNATVRYSGLINLPKYTVQNIVVDLSESVGYAVMEVKFQLERRWSLLVLTIFLPTILLIGIGYVTLFIKLPAFQVRAIMTLTTLLVLYTLFNQVSSGLPDTAYIKMIDIWFFFCIFLIFSVIIVHIAVEHLPENGDSSSAVKSVMRVSPVGEPPLFREAWLTGTWVMKTIRIFVFPFIFFIFNTVFWISIIGV
ncbi:uncharacterized protein [Palaemon carinicauda]|uniref:uncharacterized protein n=1 Tax=Palaemon carinicauda TaxID=392227 RepID=UPI0035B6AB14